MARVFITGSTEGLGRAAAQSILDGGHQVILHARSMERAARLGELGNRSLGIAIGDLGSANETRNVAEQVNAIGPMDAVIHNAGIYLSRSRGSTPEGHAITFAVNTLAPYMLTALMKRPGRLIYLSSGEHYGGEGPLRDLDWKDRRWDPARAYSESKLHVTALAFALARRWPGVLCNAVDPGWVRTRMGGPTAPVDIQTGQDTQSWLAVSDEPAVMISGRYWRHRQQRDPAPQVMDVAFQEQLLEQLRALTGTELVSRH